MQTYDLSPAAAAERLVAFLNSQGVGFDAGHDLLDAAAPAAKDSAALGYPGVAFPAAEDRAQALALRTLLLAGVGADGLGADGNTPFAQRALNALAATLPFVYRFGADGQAVPAPARDVLAARVLGDLAAVGAAGHWSRIKVCANHACGALFYDTTKARTRRWHSFELCGNKANVAAHRQRQAG